MTTDTETGLETCKFCQKTFNRQSNLMDHIDNVHLKVQSFECQLCGMKYSGKSQLTVHIKRKHSEENYTDPVKIRLPVTAKSDLNKHVESDHEESKPFKCKICDYKCATKGNIKRHIEGVHEGIKPFKCTICDFEYSEKRYLSKHIESVHEGIKPINQNSVLTDKIVINTTRNDVNTNVKVETFDMEESTGNLFEVNADPLNVESSKTNPWSVEDVSAFLKYCCPECDYIEENLRLFANHAICNHSNAETFFTTQKMWEIKVKKILKGSLDSILSLSVKIQIIGKKIFLRCKGNTLLGAINKLLKRKRFVDITQQCFALPQVNFPAND